MAARAVVGCWCWRRAGLSGNSCAAWSGGRVCRLRSWGARPATVPEEGELTGAATCSPRSGRCGQDLRVWRRPRLPAPCPPPRACARLPLHARACGAGRVYGAPRRARALSGGGRDRLHGARPWRDRAGCQASLGSALGLAMGLAEAHRGYRVVALVGDSLFHSDIDAMPLGWLAGST